MSDAEIDIKPKMNYNIRYSDIFSKMEGVYDG